jgi:hypothetical protein
LATVACLVVTDVNAKVGDGDPDSWGTRKLADGAKLDQGLFFFSYGFLLVEAQQRASADGEAASIVLRCRPLEGQKGQETSAQQTDCGTSAEISSEDNYPVDEESSKAPEVQ